MREKHGQIGNIFVSSGSAVNGRIIFCTMFLAHDEAGWALLESEIGNRRILLRSDFSFDLN